MDLQIEYIQVKDITPYKNNAKIHTDEQIKQIKNSIKEFGMNDPIAVWGKDNTIIEGHGRLIACKELGIKEVPIIRLDGLTDEQRKAYTLAHNKLTMNTDFDVDLLAEELDNICNIDMRDFGFDLLSDDLEQLDLNDLDAEVNKTNVIITINCKNINVYENIKEKLDNLIAGIDATIAVKMS